jgi:hypothetical protein
VLHTLTPLGAALIDANPQATHRGWLMPVGRSQTGFRQWCQEILKPAVLT